jgi:hypothetical protein
MKNRRFCLLLQDKVYEEIVKICGQRPVRLADKPLMCYTEATVNEVLRHTCLVYTVPHATTADLVNYFFTNFY